MREDLLSFEKRIAQARLELSELAAKYDNSDDEIVRDKMRFLKGEVLHLSKQYEMLAKELEPQPIEQPAKPVIPQSVQQQPVQQQYVSPQMQSIARQPIASQSQSIARQPIASQGVQPTKANVEPPKKKNVENIIGSSIMGVAASALIFISVILFATLGLAYLSDAIKMVACYIVSFVIIGVGLFKLRNKPKHPFFLSIAGCGVGVLYITLFLTNVYFEYINDITLFVLITMWVMFVCYLSKAKSKMFLVIGHIGIWISLIFGSVLCAIDSDEAKFLILTVYFVVAAGTLFVTHFDKNVDKNNWSHGFMITDLYILYFSSWVVMDENYLGYNLILILIVTVILLTMFLSDWTEAKVLYGFVMVFYTDFLILNIFEFFESDDWSGAIAYLVAVGVMMLAEFKKKRYEDGKYVLQTFMLFAVFISLAMNSWMHESGLVIVGVAPFVLIGVLKDNPVFKYFGMFLMFMYLCGDINMIEQFIAGLIALAAMYALGQWKNESTGYKTVWHLLSIIFLIDSCDELLYGLTGSMEVENALTYIIITVYNMVMLKVAKVKEESYTVHNIINAIMMIVGLGTISDVTDLHILVILVAVASFLMNAKRFLDGNNMAAGIYVGIKFTILMLVILGSFETSNYIVSIMLIVFSVASIALGFKCKYKALRVYGLALVMISIFKLMMIDIYYDNTWGRALSFFVSGVLCFGISMIYNYIGKKIENEE